MKRSKYLLILGIVALVAVTVFSQATTAGADMGPKPSINITFNGVKRESFYATILSKSVSTGPYSAYAPDEGWDYKNLGTYDSNYYYDDDYHNEEVESIWQTFVDYKDADGYYFLQLWWKVDGKSSNIRWGYYPPYSFKLLLYYPETDAFVTSDIYERYAFDSYFTVNMNGVDTNQSGALLTLNKSYDYLSEFVGLLCRIVITVAIEVLIALLFLINGRGAQFTIFITNVVTQLALNIALNLIYYFNGVLLYLLFYFLLELAVVIIEAVVYSLLLRKYGVPVWKSIVYALVANVVTAVAGVFLANWLPGMF